MKVCRKIPLVLLVLCACVALSSGAQDKHAARATANISPAAATLVGGSGSDAFNKVIVAVDAKGNVYLAGQTYSRGLPTTPSAYCKKKQGGSDIFVLKLDNNLEKLLAATYLGGSGSEDRASIAVAESGSVFVAGQTDSSDFPTTTAAYDSSYNRGDSDVFVAKLDSALSTLQAATFLGGRRDEAHPVLAVSGEGNVYVAGWTNSPDFPAASGVSRGPFKGRVDVFVAKLDNRLSILAAAVLLGGSQSDLSRDLCLDRQGDVYITGHTRSSNYPTTPGAYNKRYNGGYYDVFVSRLSADLKRLQGSTYLGSGNTEAAYSIALDEKGNVYVGGHTAEDFPTTAGALDREHNGYDEAFVSRLNNKLTGLQASTFLTRGSGREMKDLVDIVCDGRGHVYVTGATGLPDIAGVPAASHKGGLDIFALKVTGDLKTLAGALYVGGSVDEWRHSITVDSKDNVFVAGITGSRDFPTTAGAYKTKYSGGGDIFVFKIAK